MTAENLKDDPYLQVLDGLATCEPDPRRADRIRVRCRARLARQKRGRAGPAPDAFRSFPRFLEPALVAVACTVYLSEVLRRALSLYGL